MAVRRLVAAVLLFAGFLAVDAKAYPTALAALKSNKDLSLFVALADRSGITPYLNTSVTQATIFAPTNAAITSLAKALKRTPQSLVGYDAGFLADRLIGQHVVLGADASDKAMAAGKALKTVGKDTIKVVPKAAAAGKDAGYVIVGPQNNATEVGPDLVGGNVTIHVIDAVLLPNTVFPTIKAALAYSATTSQLAALIAKNPKLAAAAADPTTNVTLLAPTDKAFAAVTATAAGKALVADPAKLGKVLAYHALKPAELLPRFKAPQGASSFETLAGIPITVTKVVTKKGNSTVGAVTITGKSGGKAVIRKHNIIAGSSYIDVIDGVLLP